MARTPNEEQKKAIEHFGGVLLSAGAGSGKTFVLVEHIVYLVEKFIEDHRKTGNFSDGEEFVFKLRAYLSKIVLMTFTNEAAGELSLRVHKRLEEKIEEDGTPWDLVLEAIHCLSVSTIHGFCFKLLTGGYFKDFNPNAEVIGDIESKNRINTLYDQWFKGEKSSLDDSIRKLLVLNERSIKGALQSVFNNPDLRIFWETWDSEGDELDFSKHIHDVAEMSGVDLSDALNTIDVDSYDDEVKSKWFPYLVDFENYLQSIDFSKVNFFEDIIELSNKYGRIMPPRKKGLEEVQARMKYITSLKNFVKKFAEDYINYFQFKDSIVGQWNSIFKSAFHYINTNYQNIPGLTFSDLEFNVLKGLECEETVERIHNDFNYLIIDEFQDTSWVQFEIVRKIIKSDYSRLFCVGDEKQAIYGFRGGELGVFMECSKNVPTNLSLLNNYRSEENVINFNNQFFDDVFGLGIGFEGGDNHTVEVKHQRFPSEVKEAGKGLVEETKVEILIDEDLKKGPKVSNLELNEVEAEYIFNKTIELNELNEPICVLYRNLRPSLNLIEKLIFADIPFTAQVKIPNDEDPIVAIFACLIEYLLDKEKDKKQCLITIMGISELLHCDFEGDLEESVDCFFNDLSVYGIYYSYCNFLMKLNISNSNYENNLKAIKILTDLSLGDVETIWQSIRQNSSQKYSIDFKFKENPNIRIMTAHASKGLEYDHLILGGIHTNGGSINEGLFLGKLPGSFKWKKDSSQKTAFRSPMYIYESLLTREKDFSESKRLFYVACTRAVKGLYWGNIGHRLGDLSYLSNSWIDGLRVCPQKGVVQKYIETEKVEDESLLVELENRAPIFHIDNIGVSGKDGQKSSLGLVAELSVTKLATLSQCPRKFYLQNICKLDPDFLSDLDLEVGQKRIDLSEETVVSSSKRGSLIHEVLSEYVLTGTGATDLKKRDKIAYDFGVDEIKSLGSDVELISEKLIKFPIFGQMISGIPDLVVKNESSKEAEVWDYKTGALSEDKLTPYWFQLTCYAHALFLQDSELENVKIKLLFLDEKNVLEKTLDRADVSEQITQVWNKLDHLYQVNEKHCENCFFKEMCYYQTDPVD
ncbi:UvrD-helicase domain-containing protein [Halobacteriovorax sp. GB3]|uniref:UvrD-helicase domain-containing protein n=1 Tax=Halobacteriovorax sp. GB3 TaxID=2719615 RepID=UPI002362E51A|nr:UvrD-helicase domain-containing protein [Halobacteriovorax sp. GB3]MDD0852422.1 UvrD-helicase domain-containing protein [Halobacteriovorax sp. GB3]